MSIYITILDGVTAAGNAPVKRYEYDLTSNKVTKSPPDMNAVYCGGTFTFDHIDDFAKLLFNEAGAHNAMMYGITNKSNDDEFSLLSQKRIDEKSGAAIESGNYMARKKDNFDFQNKPGILFIDIDGIEDDWKDEVEKVYDAVPGLREYRHILYPSSSSNIVLPDGTQYSTIKGLHLYWAIKDASRIPEIMQLIFDRTVLNDHGKIVVSESPALLKRSTIDRSVAQAERLDFVKAELSGGLRYELPNDFERMRGDPDKSIVPMKLFNDSKLDKREQAELNSIWKELTENAFEELAEKRAVKLGMVTDPVERKAYEQRWKDHDNGLGVVLRPGWKLVRDNGDLIDVETIIDEVHNDLRGAKAKYGKMRFSDPDYNDGQSDSKIYIKNKMDITLHSFRSDGKTYRLEKRRIINSVKNNVTNARLLTEELVETNDFYSMKDGGLAFVDPKRPTVLSVVETTDENSILNFMSYADEWIDWRDLTDTNNNIPAIVIKSIVGTRELDAFRTIRGVSRIPYIGNDLVIKGETKGFLELEEENDDSSDIEKSGIFFTRDFEGIERIDSAEEAQAAIDRLIAPWMDYKFEGDRALAEAVVLGAVLTMVLRPMLKIAPGLFVKVGDVMGKGVGKTPFCEGMMRAGGWSFETKSWPNGKVEMEKVLIAHAIGKQNKALYFDNAEYVLTSGSLAGFFTAETYSGRKLAESRIVSAPTNMPVVVNGNNCELDSDLIIRFLEIGLVRREQGTPKPLKQPKEQVNHDEFVRLTFWVVGLCSEDE